MTGKLEQLYLDLITLAIRKLLDIRRRHRTKLVFEIYNQASSSLDRQFMKKISFEKSLIEKPQKEEDRTFFRHSGDVTYVPEGLFHIKSPWDKNPLASHPSVAPLIFEWKKLADAETLPLMLEPTLASFVVETKFETGLHIEALLGHLAKANQ